MDQPTGGSDDAGEGTARPDTRPADESFARYDDPYAAGGTVAYHRDRLLAGMTITLALLVAIALPFALQAGKGFFLPVTAALIVAVALVPLLEWLERRRIPSGMAAFLCLVFLLGIANMAVAAIVVPASNWVALIPQRIGRIRTTIRPLLDVYASLDRTINDMANGIALSKAHARTVTLETPSSLLSLVTTQAPSFMIQLVFAMLVIFFFLAGWSTMRRQTILRRSSFSSAMTLARVIQDVVDATSSYIATITFINLMLGLIVAYAVYVVGLPTPLMWGGLVMLLNYVPYLGPIAAAALLALGGLMTFGDPWTAATPAAMFVVLHLLEANLVTPTIVGRRLTISPLLILVSLSFWGWVWGAAGAVLAVPLLIILRTVRDAAGSPDIAGFLFESGTLASGKARVSRSPSPSLDTTQGLP